MLSHFVAGSRADNEEEEEEEEEEAAPADDDEPCKKCGLPNHPELVGFGGKLLLRDMGSSIRSAECLKVHHSLGWLCVEVEAQQAFSASDVYGPGSSVVHIVVDYHD